MRIGPRCSPPPLRYVLAESIVPVTPLEAPLPGDEVEPVPLLTRIQGSGNWSGAYIVPNHARRFTRVVGRWQVPTLAPGRRGPDDQDLPFRCSIWVGLDGKKRWTDYMPQIGSEQTLADDGTQEQHLWWQWWRRGSAAPRYLPFPIAGVPIAPGDLVLASLMALDPHRVRFHMANRTTGLFATIQVTRSVEYVLGTTAEWIVERPADPGLAGGGGGRHAPGHLHHGGRDPGPLYPLPDFGRVVFSRCAAAHAEGGVEEPVNPPFLPRLIRMTQNFAEPSRTVVISAPSILREPAATVRVEYTGK